MEGFKRSVLRAPAGSRHSERNHPIVVADIKPGVKSAAYEYARP